MNKKIFILFAFWCTCSLLHAQNLLLKGTVRFDNDSVTGLFHLGVYALASDTVLLSGGTFPTSHFALKVKRCPRMLVRASYLGYQTVEIDLVHPKADTLDLGQLLFCQKTFDLKSVTVTARRPVIKTQGWKMTVDVKNTTLSNAGSVHDMLKRTPGLVSQAGNIVVPGKGSPVFIVDNREIKNTEILNTLRSGDIESVEIDRNPSAAYAATAGAVVRIKTVRGVTNYLYWNVENDFSVRRKVSDAPSTTFKVKKGAFATMLTYSYSYFNNVNKETYYRYIYHPEYTFRNDTYFRLPSRVQTHGLVWSADIDLAPRHRLGIQYFFQHAGFDEPGYGNSVLFNGTEEIHKRIDRTEESKRSLHSISLAYNYDIGPSSALTFVTDYAAVDNRLEGRTVETYLSPASVSDIRTRSSGNFDIYTAEGTYRFLLPYRIKGEVGSKYAYVYTPTRTWTDNPLSVEHGYADRTQTSDQITSGYFSFSGNWNKFNLQAGGRYEYAQTKIRTFSGTEEASLNRYFSDFFPNIRAGLQLPKNWNIYLAYSKTISRPGFPELNPSKFYKDSLTYSSGDPATLPTYTHHLSLNLNWKTWSLSLMYRRIKDKRMITYLTDDDGRPDVVREKPVNIRRSENYYAYLSYYCYQSRWNFFGSLGGRVPYLKIPYLNRMRTVDKFSWMVNLNAEFSINKTFTIHSDFTYESENESLSTYQYATNQWNIGIRGSFFKNKLEVDLYATDLLHGSNYNNLYDRYLNVMDGTRGTNDFRGIALKLTYTLFNHDIQVKSRRGNQDVLDRTE